MTTPIKLAALFAGALLVLAQTSGAAEAGHGHKQVQTAAKQGQAFHVWDQHKFHKHGKAYSKRGHYGNDAYRQGKRGLYGKRGYYGNDAYMHGKAYGRRAQWQYQGWQYQGWQYQGRQYRGRQYQGRQYQGRQYQAQRQRQRRHIAQVWRSDQTYLDRRYGN